MLLKVLKKLHQLKQQVYGMSIFALTIANIYLELPVPAASIAPIAPIAPKVPQITTPFAQAVANKDSKATGKYFDLFANQLTNILC
jgi:hypothetical protein